MATTLVTMPLTMPAREVLRCEHCALVQFRTNNSMCRRCHKPLDVEEAPTPIEIVAPSQTPPSSQDAGLRVAAQVKDIRRARHLSQRQLAGRMQVPRTYISKIENGKAMPTLSSLDRLARALQVDISALLRDAPRRHQDETAVLTTDPFLAEIAKYAEHLTSTQKSIFINHVRELAQGHTRRTA